MKHSNTLLLLGIAANWSFSPVMYDKLADYPFVDSVYIARLDTASYTLTF